MDTTMTGTAPGGISSGTSPPTRREAFPAFTLVELLVVLSIVALLMAVFLPAFHAAHERGRVAKCMANLRSIGQAVIIYADDHQDRLPPGDCGIPWMVWWKPDECRDSSDTLSREVNLGYVLKAGILPMPTSFDSVLWCPSSRHAYPTVTAEAFRRWWGSHLGACITYMYNESLDGFAGGPPDGKGTVMAHKNAINFVRADGSVDTFRPGRLIFAERHGPEDLTEVINRYGTAFPSPVVFHWLEQGAVDLAEAREYLRDAPTWCEKFGVSTPRKAVLLTEVGSKPLVSDAVGRPKYG